MDSTRRLLFHLFLIFLNKELRVYSQNVTPRGSPQSSATVVNNNSNGEYVNYNINQGTPTPKLMNTLLTVAATKGVLPEILPALKGTVISDDMQQSPYLPEGAELNRNFFQNQPSKTYITTNIPNYSFQPDPISSTTFSTSISPSVSWLGPEIFTVSNPTLTGQQSLYTSGIPSYDISPSYQSNQPSYQPSFSSLQYQPLGTQTNKYPFALSTLTEFNPTQQNIQTDDIPAVIQADQSLPPVRDVVTENQLDNLQTIVTTDDNGQKLPIQIHINMPSPNMSTPKIAIVSLTPANIPNSPATDDLPAFEHFPQPIIIESSKSKSKLWLPILLMSLLSNDNGRGCCGCGCSCSCNNSANNVPIPFPIAIPMNNPVVATGNYRSATKSDSSG